MKKKVLYISPNGYLGGAEKFVLTAVEAHQNSNHIEAEILFFNNGEAVSTAEDKNVKVHVLKTKFRMRNPLTFLKAIYETRCKIKKISPTVIHSTMAYAHIVISLATIGLKLKKVWFQHGPVGGWLDFIGNFFKTDVLIYNSHDLKERHHQSFLSPRVSKNEVILKLGVNNFNFTEKDLSHKKIVFGTAGRITEWKGFHLIIEAFLQLLKETNQDFTFYLAGSAKNISDKSYEQKLHQMVRRSRASDKIIFLGHQKEMSEFYRKIDVFIHSSTIPEPFGLVVAEAMSSGCLVIGSNIGGVRDILKNDETGITFSSTSPTAVSELTEIIKKVLFKSQGDHQFEKLAQNGKKFIHQHYSITAMTKDLENIYMNL